MSDHVHPVADPDRDAMETRAMDDELRDLSPSLPGPELPWPPKVAGPVGESLTDRVARLAGELDALVPTLPLGGLQARVRFVVRDLCVEYGLPFP